MTKEEQVAELLEPYFIDNEDIASFIDQHIADIIKIYTPKENTENDLGETEDNSNHGC